jgi:preprotein translocase subunit SecA
MATKDAKFGAAGIRHMQRMILLHALDNLWREHLVTLEALRRAIGWRSYGRRQPLTEYKTEALHLFETMLRHLDAVVTALTMRVGIVAA